MTSHKPIPYAYVNQQFVPEQDAKVSVFDRGFLFADAVYEVCAVVKGRLLDKQAHLARLQRSLNELSIPTPDLTEIDILLHEIVKRNQLNEGLVYLQISRGAAPRDFAIPQGIKPTVVIFTQVKNLLNSPMVNKGIKVISVEDIRWQRCDIKSVALLAASLAKQQALDQGADDAWFVRDGKVLEGTSNNTFIITQDNKLITRPLDHAILHGTTRAVILKLVQETALALEERTFTLAEAYKAKEAFITSAGTFAWPVVSIDQQVIGDGKPGALTLKLRELYLEFVA